MSENKIKCPECEGANLVMEPPTWIHSENEEIVEVNSWCIDCKCDFRTSHKLSKPLKVYNIKLNVDYPY